MGRPRLSIAAAFLVLAALATTLSYTGWLVVGVLADYLDTGRFVAGLLLACVFARFPRISGGKLRLVGLLLQPLRRPAMASVLGLCLLRFVLQGESVSALVTGLTLAFVLGFPCLKSLVFARMTSSVFNFAAGAGRNAPVAVDDTVIDGEFREMKE